MKMSKTEAYEFGMALIDAASSEDTMQVLVVGDSMVAVPTLNGETFGRSGVIVEHDPSLDGVQDEVPDIDNVVPLSA